MMWSSQPYAQLGLSVSDLHHPGVRPAGRALLGEDRLDGGLLVLGQVHDHLPRGADDGVAGLEGLDLLQVVRPVLTDVLALLLEQVDGSGELVLVERVGVLDAEVGLRLHQVEGGVGDVDRRVVGRDLAGVRRRVVEDRAPARRRGGDDVGVVHQQVGAVAVRDAVHLAADGVPVAILEERPDVGVVGDQVGVDRGHVTAGDESQGRVARGGHHVVLTRLHQVHRLVGGAEVLDVDLAARLLLEGGHPVDGLVRGAVLRVAGPGQHAEAVLELPDLRRPSGRPER